MDQFHGTTAAMRLLLISSSTIHGSGYLDHCAAAIERVLRPAVARVLFVPYALRDRDGYAARVRARFARMGFEVDSIHESAGGPAAAVARAEAMFIGGGNTFRLLDALWRFDLIEPIGRRVRAGMPYIGSSAGSNVACITIKTTNDMPIVQPPTFDALGLVPFNLNPHYLDPDPGSTHMGETREERIMQLHEENAPPVVGLREGAWLEVDDRGVTLEGAAGARLFRRGQAPIEYSPGTRLPL
jgi:dipeptidase E